MDPCPPPPLTYLCINVIYVISIKLEQKQILLENNPTFSFLKLWLTIVAGDMASLLDKAKQFVSDAAASIEKPKASVTDVDLKDVGVSCVTYLAKINVSNPYSVSIPIGEIRYVLKSSGRFVCYHFVYLPFHRVNVDCSYASPRLSNRNFTENNNN